MAVLTLIRNSIILSVLLLNLADFTGAGKKSET